MKLKFNPLPLGDGLNFFCYVLVSGEAPVVLHSCLFFFEDYGIIIYIKIILVNMQKKYGG